MPTIVSPTGATHPGHRWWSIRSMPARLVVCFVVLLGVDVLWQLANSTLHAPAPGDHAGMWAIVSAVGLSIVMIAAYRILVRWIEGRTAEEIGLRHAVALGLAGALCGVALFAGVEMILTWKGIAHIGGYAGTGYLGHAVGVALSAAVAEEIVFRGVVFRVIEEGFGTLAGLVCSAALFGALHGFNPGASLVSGVAIALEAGILLAAAYAATRSLWLPIGLHFGWNFAEGGIFGAAVSGHAAHGLVSTMLTGDALWTGGAFGPEASIAAVAVCVLASVVLLALAIGRGNWQPVRLRIWGPAFGR